MRFKFLSVCFVLCVFCLSCESGKTVTNNSTQAWVQTALEKGVQQYKYLAKTTKEGVLPRTYLNGTLKTTSARNWVSGFYPGTLLYLYKATGDTVMYNEALKRIVQLTPMQFFTDHHDLGFMMFCSYGNLYKLDPKPAYKEILVNAARSLAKRYSPVVKSIRSWGKIEDKDEFLVIIDNMMNLELLMWAAKVTNDKTLSDIAIHHANTTLINHFRADNSSYHVVAYNPVNGSVVKKRTAQGAFDESAWARGQAWGLYGFTMMYRETGDKKYLKKANEIAEFIIAHKNLPADEIPYWDFNAPKIPEEPRDASTGSIVASALFELAGYVDSGLARKYISQGYKTISSLASPEYTASYKTNGGFILKHSVSNKNKNVDVDAPLTYADYYYIEALLRYKGLSKNDK